jgi:2-dehydropantoate 2-reductase
MRPPRCERVSYVVYGAGAIGGTIAARLFEAGHDVTMIARGAHFAALAANGLRYGDPDATRVLPISVVDHPAAVTWHGDDIVVLAVKSEATEGALRDLVAAGPGDVAVVCAQNGVENERAALRRFDGVYGMCVMMPATHMEAGAVDADSLPIVGVLDVGRYPNGSDGVAEQLASDLSSSGFRSVADTAIMRWKYEKLLLNLATAVRAICGPEGVDDDHDRPLRGAIVAAFEHEATECYQRAGIVRPSAAERAARWDGALTPRPIPGRPRAAGSAWQSLARGTGTIESDYVNGEIVLLGRLHGVPTPVNAAVQRLANELARRRCPPGSLSLRDLAATAGLG